MEDEEMQPVEDEAMDQASDDESDDSSEEDTAAKDQLFSELEQRVNENVYAYDPHVTLIKALRENGELERLRTARKNMSKIFPLTEDLWLEWLQDEVSMASSSAERQIVNQLFDKAVKDYLSVAIWLEYVQFSIGGMAEEDGITNIRHVFERALTAAGLHVTKGINIWEAYREFESAILAGLQPPPGSVSTKEQEDQVMSQTNRITAIFKRQLSIPLQGMEDAYEEYKEWISEDVDRHTEQTYDKALNNYSFLIKYEDGLTTAKPPRLEQYKAYIDHELSGGDPARIQCLYERALQENALNPELWQQYTHYLDGLKIPNLILPAYERAVSNCPWAVDLWICFAKALERLNQPHETIKEKFSQALHSGFTQSTEFLQLWTAYCDYLRRRIHWTEEHDTELQELRDTFEEAVNHLSHYYGKDGDTDCVLQKYWARIEAKCCKNMEKARLLWNEVMQAGHGNQAQAWLTYYNLERAYGDHKHCRKILQRALNSASDFPESICEAYINFEREDGTLQDLDTAMVRCEAQLKRVRERRAKIAEKEAEAAEQVKKVRAEKKAAKKYDNQKQQPHKPNQNKPHQRKTNPTQPRTTQPSTDTKAAPQTEPVAHIPVYTRKNTSNQATPKRKIEETAEVDTEGFKVPLPPSPTSKSSGRTSPGGSPKSDPPLGFKPKSAPPPGFKAKSAPPPGFRPKSSEEEEDAESAEPQSKKMKVTEETSQESTSQSKPDGSKENRTVFVSNIDYSLTEDFLKEMFTKVGEISEIRLVKNFKGQSKGYAYVEFIDELPVTEALKLDRTPIEGRPIYVSRCEEKANRGPQFKFSTEMEKNKLFVKGLPFSCLNEDLEKMFSEHGKLKDVRLVTYRSGASKGLAYVEFENENDATQAVMKMDGLQMGEHTISVSISNPPARKAPLKQRGADSSYTVSLGSGKKQTAVRGRASKQLSMMPRALNRSKPNQDKPQNGSSEKPADTQATPMSNDDFRNMLLRK